MFLELGCLTTLLRAKVLVHLSFMNVCVRRNGGYIPTDKTRNIRRKSVTVPLFPPQSPRGFCNIQIADFGKLNFTLFIEMLDLTSWQ